MTKKVVHKTNRNKSGNDEKFEPTKVALAVAAAASTCLVLFAVIAIYG